MFSIQNVVKGAIEKMSRKEPLSKFEQLMFERTKAEAKRNEKIRKKFTENFQHIYSIDTGNRTKEGKPSIVPVFRKIYNGKPFKEPKDNGVMTRQRKRAEARQYEKDKKKTILK